MTADSSPPPTELVGVLDRLSRMLLEPMDPGGLSAAHLRRLIGRLLKACEANVDDEPEALRNQPISWKRMKDSILREQDDARRAGKRSRAFAESTFKGVPKDIKNRLKSFKDRGAEDYLGGMKYRFWFELESTGRQGVRLIVKREPASTASSRRLVRAVLSTFQRRDAEFGEIERQFSRTPPAEGICLFGIPGSGKTELAIYAANQLDGFPGGVFFIDASELNLQALFARIFHSLDVSAPAEIDVAVLQHHYMQLRGRPRTLLVLDDISPSIAIECLRPPQGLAFLMTCRKRLHAGWIASVAIGELNEAETRQFLVANTGISQDQGAESMLRIFAHSIPGLQKDSWSGHVSYLDVIGVLCGRLPSALALAATTLRNRRHANDYGEQLRRAQSRVRAVGWSPGSNSVEQGFRSVYSQLARDAQKLLSRLSVFYEPFDAAEATCVFGDDAQGALDSLEGYGLVRWHPDIKRYSLNELVRDFAATVLNETQEEAFALEPLAQHFAARSHALTERYSSRPIAPSDAIADSRFRHMGELERAMTNTIASSSLWLQSHRESSARALLPHLVIALSRSSMLPNRIFPEDHLFDVRALVEAAVEAARATGDLKLLRRVLLCAAGLADDPAVLATEGLRLTAEHARDEYESALEKVIRERWLPSELSERIRIFADKLKEETIPAYRISDARRLVRALTYAGRFSEADRVSQEAASELRACDRRMPPKAYWIALATDRVRNALCSGDLTSANELVSEIWTADQEQWSAVVAYHEELGVHGTLPFDVVEPIALRAELLARLHDGAAREALAEAIAFREEQLIDERSERALLDIGRAAYHIGDCDQAEGLLWKASNGYSLSYEEKAEAYLWIALMWKQNGRLEASRDFMWTARKAFRATECFLRPIAEATYTEVAQALGWRGD